MKTAAAPHYRRTVVALALGQIVCWAALYYAFTAFVLPIQRELGWSKPTLMGAYTTGLTIAAALSFAVGAAIDRGHGRAVLTLGPLLGALGFGLWAIASSVAALYAAWALLGAAMAMTLYEPAFTVVTRLYPARFREAVTAITLVGGFASTLCFPAVALLQAQLGWQRQEPAVPLFEDFRCAGAAMDRQVVEDNSDSGGQERGELGLDPGVEGLPVYRAGDDPWGDQAVMCQSCDECLGHFSNA